jgi:hypothetical protein
MPLGSCRWHGLDTPDEAVTPAERRRDLAGEISREAALAYTAGSHLHVGKEKFLYDHTSGAFKGATNAVRELLNGEGAKRGLAKALKMLGEAP